MTNANGISRRKFLATSMGGVAAASLRCWDVFGDQKPKADLIIHGSPVLSVDNRDRILGAVAVRGNSILATAKDVSHLREFIGQGTQVVKYTRGCVTPGMIDVHNHIVGQAGMTMSWVDLMKCNSSKNVRETIAKWVIENEWPPGEWILGQGYMWMWDKIGANSREGLAGPPLVSRFDLDQVVEVSGKKVDLSQYPIYLYQLSGHYATVNALALIKAKIMDRSGKFYSGKNDQCLTVPKKTVGQAFSPEGRAFSSFFSVSNKGGVKQLDGMIFHHYAMEELFVRAAKFGGLEPLNDSEVIEGLKQRCGEFIRKGVTSIYDNNLRMPKLLSALRDFPGQAEVGEKVRLTLYPYICHLDMGAFPAFDKGRRKGVTSSAPLFDGNWMRLIGYKLQIDAGTMTGLTWEPNRSSGDMTQGKLNLWEYNDFLEIVRALDRQKAQISIHVAGDKALDWSLDAYEQAGVGGTGRRHRLEHVVCVPQRSMNTPKGKRVPLYPRARDLNLVFCPQPGFILFYAPFMDNAFGAGAGRLKQNKIYPRVTHSIPFRSCLEAGLKVALSSDSPCVMDPSPLVALWESVHRRTRRFQKEREVLLESYVFNHPDEQGDVYDERVDIMQALRGHTVDAAYAGYEDAIKGSLESGKLADIVIWNDDIRILGNRVSVTKTRGIKPVMTVIDGKIAYRDTASVRIERV
jgi:predicted amidohydrolase YtcJ